MQVQTVCFLLNITNPQKGLKGYPLAESVISTNLQVQRPVKPTLPETNE